MANPNQRAAYRGYESAAASDTTHSLNVSVQEPRRRVFVSRVAAKNATRAASTCKVYVNSGGRRFHLADLTLTVQDTWYGAQVDTWVYAGEAVEFAFASVAVADHLTASAFGVAEYSGSAEAEE
jgi:hypothetical protein